MKRTFICLLSVFAFATAGAAIARAAGTEITASGTGSVSLAPNIATVTAAVETNAQNADEAVSNNNAIYGRIVAALEKADVARNDVTLAYYNVSYNPRPRNAPPASDERYGFTVSRSFSVKVRRIADAGRVSDACMSSGATAINGIAFGLSDPVVARQQATAKAVAEARANAEAIARAADLRIVGIKSIELGGEPTGPVPLMRAAAVANVPTQFDQSNVNITISVTVVFVAEP
jgi:uncharacterized protein YggE